MSQENKPASSAGKMQKIISLCKRRGFIYPGSEIYGGLANSWDFGPLGAQLKKNIKDLWWQYFVVNRDDVIGIDAALMMNPKVWEASGHVAGFTDPLVECKECHQRFRADHLEISKLKTQNCPQCGGILTQPKAFNLMFKTFIGPVDNQANAVYLRPETAQAMFVNFKNILDSTRIDLPFGIAQIGKAFRNEITPGNFIFRVLEFEQMEIEYFIPASLQGWEKFFGDWQEQMSNWLKFIGINSQNYAIREHAKDELSHYSKRTIDFEYKFPFGQKELYGLAYRTDFDLKNHEKHNVLGVNLEYTDPQTGEKFIPHVIEPTFGVERTILAVLCDAFEEVEGGRGEGSRQEKEVVLRLDKKIAPIKVAIFPLAKKEPLILKSREIVKNLRQNCGHLPNFVIAYDDSGSIGKRYRRQDEIGTPYCVTVDFETVEDQSVTVRDRDTMKQERVGVGELSKYFEEKFNK